MGLFAPSYLSNNTAKALKTVQQLVDQAELLRAAKTAPVAAVRSAAVVRLDDQRAIADVVMTDSQLSVQQAAVARITDQSVLAEIALNSPVTGVKTAAVTKLVDQLVLARVIISLSIEFSRHNRFLLKSDQQEIEKTLETALGKTTDESCLADIAIEGEYPLSTRAADGLHDQSLIVKVALASCRDYLARDEAVARIADQNILKDYALSHGYYSGGKEALDRVSDQDKLKEIAAGASHHMIRDSAMERIEDKAFIEKVRREHSHTWEQINQCIRKCQTCGLEAGEHRYAKVGSDYYSGRSDFKCEVCGDTHSEYTSMGVG